MLTLCFSILLFWQNSEYANLELFRESYMQGIQAFRDDDMATFHDATQKAHKQNPDHVGVRFNLAIAKAQTKRHQEAIQLLSGLAESGLVMPLDTPWLKPVQEDPNLKQDWEKLKAAFAANRTPMLKAQVWQDLPRKDFFAEGIAHDGKTQNLYVGSVHHREIVRFDKEGRSAIFVPQGHEGLMSVLGMAVDSERQTLWVCSSGLKQTRELDSEKLGTAELLAFELESGALLRKISVPKQEQNNLNDIVVAADGGLYLSDANSGAIYHLPVGAEKLQVLLNHGSFRSPQGLVLLQQDRILMIADYSHGLFRLDLKTKALQQVAKPNSLVLAGIDGLLGYENQLIAIQNGVRPHRILKLTLENEGKGIASVEVLERAHPKFDEPTLGVIYDQKLIFVAASQWPHYDSEGKPLAAEALRQPQLLQLRLKP
jgi:sugar lactone lactonase YvrE